jgi:hypothetical protein
VAVPCGIGWVRWTTGWLPRGTVVGPTCQVFAPGWGPLADVDQWGSTMWHSAAEVAQSGAAMWHCNSNRIFELVLFLVPKLHLERSMSLSCTQRSL